MPACPHRVLVKILLFLLEHYNEPEPINVGHTDEKSIKFIAEQIAGILDFRGEIIWDTSKPKGQYRKPSSNQKFIELLNSVDKPFSYTDLKIGLRRVCEWFVIMYPRLRGIR